MEWPVANKAIMDIRKEIQNDAFSARFFDIPYYIGLDTEDIGYLTGKRVLDFGCRNGETTCGTALFHNPSSVLGVDFGEPWNGLSETVRKTVGLDALPSNLAFSPIGADYRLPETEFHFVYSWGAFASIPRPDLSKVVERIYERLRIGGRALIQVSPLYLSARGSQLGGQAVGNWEHLLLEPDDLRSKFFAQSTAPSEVNSGMWKYFESLSKISPAEILDMFLQAGFYKVRQREFFLDLEPPEALLQEHSAEDLKRNQVIFVFGKA